MTPEEFKISWENHPDDTLTQFSQSVLAKFNLLPDTARFLSTAGLPVSAAPFLDFVQKEGGGYNSIRNIRDVYNFLEPEFDRYIVIGSDNCGNPIVINTEEKDRIEWLDHEDMFSPHFFNSSIIKLARCLSAQREFIDMVIKENGEDAILKSNFTDNQFAMLKTSISNIDPQCLTGDSFWQDSLQSDLANRAYYQANP